jgi:hypothetical protein
VRNHPDVLVITYSGTHRFGFYKDCRENSQNLHRNLREMGVEIVEYRFRDLLRLTGMSNSNMFYFFTRYGAGAWFWKPSIIRHALQVYKPTHLIYVDVDCIFLRNPSELTSSVLNESDLAFFSHRAPIGNKISKRAQRNLGLDSDLLSVSAMVTAGVVILRNSEAAIQNIRSWELAMEDPRNLLNPVFSFSKNHHLHDQSVLSALIAQRKIDCGLITTGFYSSGPESNSASLENSWMYTGNLKDITINKELGTRILLGMDFYGRKIYDIVKTFLIYPLHLTFYLVQRFIQKHLCRQRVI